jgi:uncharacterized protein Usg
MVDKSFTLQLQDYRLTTAEIIYRLPDHPSFLQSYIWQELDIAPKFPVLNKFLTFWERELQGQLYHVKVMSAGIITPAEYRFADAEFRVH